MKKYLPFLFFFSTFAAAQWFYGSGTAQNLENKLTFKNTVSAQTGNLTPTSGVSASTGSVYQKTDGTFWTKQYGATTSWARVATSSELSAYATIATLSNYVSKVDTATQTIVSKFVINPTSGDILDLQTASSSVFKVETDGDFFFTTDVYNGKRGVSTNLFSGTSAGAGITTGLANTCHGYECLQTITTGQRNTAIGYQAGKTSTLSSSDNTSLGAAALGTSTTGVRNTAVGSVALQLHKTGGSNVCIGYACLPVNQSGNRNTAVGADTGALSTNSDNIYLGYGAGSTNTASNKFYVATGTALNLLYGDTALGQLGVATGSLHSTTAFEVNSTSGVFYPPRMSTAQRTAISALSGGILYDTTAARFYGHDGSSYDYFVESADLSNYVSKTDTATQTMAGALALGAVQATASSGMVVRNSSGATVATFGDSGTGATFSNSLVVQGQTTLATTLTGPLRASSGVVATGSINVNSEEVTGVLNIANGGTNNNAFTNGHVVIASGSKLQGLAGTSTNDVLAWNGTAWVPSAPSSGNAKKIATIKDTKPAGNGGGSGSTSVWVVRTLNTLRDPDSVISSLSSNIFTISTAGVYYISGSAPGHKINRHKTRLRDVSSGVTRATGSNEYSDSADNVTTRSVFGDVVNIATPTSFRVEHFMTNSGTGSDFGLSTTGAGEDEVYTEITVERLQ